MRCIALFSGGIDSILAVRLMQEQNIGVEALNVKIGLETDDYEDRIDAICNELGIKCHIIDDSDQFLNKALYKTIHGYNEYLDPCLDYKANYYFMAWERMKNTNADFIISGDVLDQKSSDQLSAHFKALDEVLGEIRDYLLRPLSAKLLEPTIPEKEGWVDREKLMAFSGKSKKPIMELFHTYHYKDYLVSKGCFLSNESFSKRLKIFHFKYEITKNNIPLFMIGRFFLVNDYVLLIGKNDLDNAFIQNYKDDNFIKIMPEISNAPYALLDRFATEEEKKYACRVILKYAKTDDKESAKIKIGDTVYDELPMSDEEVCHSMI